MKVVCPVSSQRRKVVDGVVDGQQVVKGLAGIVLVDRLRRRLERPECHKGIAVVVVVDYDVPVRDLKPVNLAGRQPVHLAIEL